MSGIKGIIFDYGGTIDSFGNHWSEVIYESYLKCGLNIDKNEFRTSYVEAERELARNRHILPHFDFLDLMRVKIRIELDDLFHRGIIKYDDIDKYSESIAAECNSRAVAAVDSVKDVIELLSEQFPLMLVSNFYGNVESVLRQMGIRQYFKGIIESAVVGVRKPNPTIFKLGVVALELEPEEVLVVGDSLKKDILPALSIGCKVAWLKGKGWTAEEDAAEHWSRIASLRELL